jgi:hypothetical protein
MAAWAMRKARRAAGRLDGEVDRALDEAMDRLYALVFGKLAADPALTRLQADAQRGVEDLRTQKRVQLAVEDAVDQDPRFAAELRQALQRVQALETSSVRRVKASGKSIAVGGEFTGNHVGHRFGALGAVTVVLIGALTFLYYQSTHGGPPASEIAYQQQALATCEQAHAVASANHLLDIFRSSPVDFSGGPNEPRFGVDKAALMDLMNNNLVQIKTIFAQFDQREVPSSLADRKKTVDQAFAVWVTSAEQDMRTVKATVRDGMSFDQLQHAFMAAGLGNGPNVTYTRFIGAMSDLAGKTCTI